MKKNFYLALLCCVVGALSSCSRVNQLALEWKYRGEYRQLETFVKRTEAGTAYANTQLPTFNSDNEQTLTAITTEAPENVVANTAKTAVANMVAKQAIKKVNRMLEKNGLEEQKISYSDIKSQLKDTQIKTEAKKKGGLPTFLLLALILLLLGVILLFVNNLAGLLVIIVALILFLYWLFTSM